MNATSFAIVGGGFRTQFFLKVARELPERFQVSGMVVRNPSAAQDFERTWGVKTFASLEALLQSTRPDFAVVSVTPNACEKYLFELAELGIPALAETPPAAGIDGLLRLDTLSRQGAKVQVAEQYHFRPMQAARLAVIESGLLGDITEASVSVSHGYHGVNLIRKFLGVGMQTASIRAMRFESPIVAGPTRSGPPSEERIISARRDIAWLEFGDKLGIYDFTRDQHRSWIRSSHVSILGVRGEINDHRVLALHDFATPQVMDFMRIKRGEEENLEGHFLSGILLGERWVYRNPFPYARLYDDEIAVATCMVKMADYIRGGPSFYDLKDASQDHYLGMLIEQAIQTGETLTAAPQPWTGTYETER